MSSRLRRYNKSRSSKRLCQEKFNCKEEFAEAIFHCEECGSLQCKNCELRLHELKKFCYHDRTKLIFPPKDELCHSDCTERNYADVHCEKCVKNYCHECYERYHNLGKKKTHTPIPLSQFNKDKVKNGGIVSVPDDSADNFHKLNVVGQCTATKINEKKSGDDSCKSDENGIFAVGITNAILPLSPIGLQTPNESLTYFSMPQNEETVVEHSIANDASRTQFQKKFFESHCKTDKVKGSDMSNSINSQENDDDYSDQFFNMHLGPGSQNGEDNASANATSFLLADTSEKIKVPLI